MPKSRESAARMRPGQKRTTRPNSRATKPRSARARQLAANVLNLCRYRPWLLIAASSSDLIPAISSRVYLAQRSGPPPDRSFSCPRGRSPDRLTSVLTAPIVKAAANPQITPIRTPESKPPVHHSTPRLTSNRSEEHTSELQSRQYLV